MTRDTRRDKEYFNKWVDFTEKSQKRRESKLSTLTSPSGRVGSASDLFSDLLEICTMKYSRGDDISTFSDDIKKVSTTRSTMFKMLDNLSDEDKDIKPMYTRLDLYLYLYHDYFVWLGFLYYIGASQQEIKEALTLIGHQGEDALLDRLSVLLGDTERPVADSGKMVFKKIYTPLLKVVEAAENDRPLLMKKFVEGWYKSMKPAAWHGNDQGGEGAYYGYWCFEAALVVNLLKIDDSSFRDNVYYPKDLVIR